MLKKILQLITVCVAVPFNAYATGMAVSLPNLYLQNNTQKTTVVTVKNIGESGTSFQLRNHSICRVKGPIMFLPFAQESNNFVVMVANGGNSDPIVIDKIGLLTLAHDSTLGFSYSGNVKNNSFTGFCGNKLGQSKFLNVEPQGSGDTPPAFNLKNCSSSSNFVYSINDNYVKVDKRSRKLNFAKITDCIAIKPK